jgi:hypothetical protein
MMSAVLRSVSHTPRNLYSFASSSALTMSTRNLPTPPPEGPAVVPAETGLATPPTTGTEEAAALADPPPAQPQPAQIHTIYREVFPIFANKAMDKDWPGLAMLAELHDLRVCPMSHASNPGTPNLVPRDLQTEHEADPSRLLLTVPLVLSYLIMGDMYDFEPKNSGPSLNAFNQSSRPVRVNPPPLAAATPPHNRRAL